VEMKTGKKEEGTAEKKPLGISASTTVCQTERFKRVGWSDMASSSREFGKGTTDDSIELDLDRGGVNLSTWSLIKDPIEDEI